MTRGRQSHRLHFAWLRDSIGVPTIVLLVFFYFLFFVFSLAFASVLGSLASLASTTASVLACSQVMALMLSDGWYLFLAKGLSMLSEVMTGASSI